MVAQPTTAPVLSGPVPPLAAGFTSRQETGFGLAKSLRLGDPLDPGTEMGPLTSAGHRDRVMSYIDVAREQGSAILAGGKPPDDPALRAG